MNLTRDGTAVVVGIASAVADTPAVTPVSLGGQSYHVATIIELLAVVAGVGLQQFSPYTMPDVVDGLLDGGLALVARRGATNIMQSQHMGGYAMFAQRVGGQFVAPQLMGGYGAFGQIGSVGGVPRRKLV